MSLYKVRYLSGQCQFYYPYIMEYNLTTSANKYVMIARALDEDTSDISVIEAAIKAVEGIRKIYIELKIPPRLSEYEVKKKRIA